MAKLFKKLNRKTKVNDALLLIERALKQGLARDPDMDIHRLTMPQLLQFTEGVYYKALDNIRGSHASEEDLLKATERMERLETAMTLARNLMYSEGEMHRDQAHLHQ